MWELLLLFPISNIIFQLRDITFITQKHNISINDKGGDYVLNLQFTSTIIDKNEKNTRVYSSSIALIRNKLHLLSMHFHLQLI